MSDSNVVTCFDADICSNQLITIIMETYLYLNHSGLVVYHDLIDSATNKNNKQLKRYVINIEYAGLFIRYYQLKLHAQALANTRK